MLSLSQFLLVALSTGGGFISKALIDTGYFNLFSLVSSFAILEENL